MFQRICQNINIDKGLAFKVFLIVFTVTLTIILLVQLVLLPYVFTSWHAGNGLLIGGDWIEFHDAAVEMAQKIKDEGWSAWELWPKGWFPSGIAGTFYALIWPAPWVLAPLNAAVHAFTALMVINIINYFSRNKIISVIAMLPFIFFPSAMLWYTQIHRDGYNILGMLLFLYGLLLILSSNDKIMKCKYPEAVGYIAALIGTVLLWVSRPHTVIIFQYAGLMLFLLVLIFFTVRVTRKKLNWNIALYKLVVFTMVLVSMLLFTRAEGAGKYQRAPDLLSEGTFTEANDSEFNKEQILLASNSGLDKHIVANASEPNLTLRFVEDFKWSQTPFLPAIIDNQFYSIAVMRTFWYPISYGASAVNIDGDVSFHSAIDFVYYLPRALQIAYFAPFPGDWFGEGRHETTTFFRRISALEMIVVYLMIVTMVYGIWIWRRKIEVYILFFFCTMMTLPIIYSIPNLGTIYRYRYGYIMLLVSFGVAALGHLLKRIFIRNSSNEGY